MTELTELSEAAERLREYNASSSYSPDPYNDGSELDVDRMVLADAYLDFHPPDSDVPIDEEWLRIACRKCPGGISTLRVGASQIVVVIRRLVGVSKRFETRGDVRQLFRALGIELTETEQNG